MKETMMSAGNNSNNDNGNYDMQQLMNIVGQSAMNLNNMGKQLGIVANAVNDIRSDVEGLSGRMDILEQKEEITTEQAATINRAVRKRVGDILGNNEDDLAKYRRIFSASLYGDARKYAGLGNTYPVTKKENIQRVIDYIEAWIPSCGCTELKKKADIKAEARRKAKELGYVA